LIKPEIKPATKCRERGIRGRFRRLDWSHMLIPLLAQDFAGTLIERM